MGAWPAPLRTPASGRPGGQSPPGGPLANVTTPSPPPLPHLLPPAFLFRPRPPSGCRRRHRSLCAAPPSMRAATSLSGRCWARRSSRPFPSAAAGVVTRLHCRVRHHTRALGGGGGKAGGGRTRPPPPSLPPSAGLLAVQGRGCASLVTADTSAEEREEGWGGAGCGRCASLVTSDTDVGRTGGRWVRLCASSPAGDQRTHARGGGGWRIPWALTHRHARPRWWRARARPPA